MVWNRPPVDFVQTQALAWRTGPLGELGNGGLVKTLSVDPDDGAETRLVQVRTPQRGRAASAWDLFVLEGHPTIDGQSARPGSYVHVPAGSPFELIPGLPRTTVHAASFGSFGIEGEVSDATAGPAPAHLDDLEWLAPTWSGDRRLAPGAFAKTLRSDELGLMMVTAKLPGWSSPDLEVHPTYEENFKLSGDTLMGAQGVLRSGAYYFRHPGVWHGPLHTQGGTITIIRSDAPITTEYRPAPPGEQVQDLLGLAYGHGVHRGLTDPDVLGATT